MENSQYFGTAHAQWIYSSVLMVIIIIEFAANFDHNPSTIPFTQFALHFFHRKVHNQISFSKKFTWSSFGKAKKLIEIDKSTRSKGTKATFQIAKNKGMKQSATKYGCGMNKRLTIPTQQ